MKNKFQYKRALIINDDTKEDFFRKYKSLQMYEGIISYCNNPKEAFEYITSDNFGG